MEKYYERLGGSSAKRSCVLSTFLLRQRPVPGGRFANCTPQPHPHVVHLVRVWLWRNYIPGQGVTVMPGVELNLSAPVIFAVPAPAAGQDALPPLEVKFTVPVLLAVTVCVVLL